MNKTVRLITGSLFKTIFKLRHSFFTFSFFEYPANFFNLLFLGGFYKSIKGWSSTDRSSMFLYFCARYQSWILHLEITYYYRTPRTCWWTRFLPVRRRLGEGFCFESCPYNQIRSFALFKNLHVVTPSYFLLSSPLISHNILFFEGILLECSLLLGN